MNRPGHCTDNAHMESFFFWALNRAFHPVACVIELLEQLDLSEGLMSSARTGLYWIHRMLADAVKHVSEGLRVE